jgi:hypothetical protein
VFISFLTQLSTTPGTTGEQIGSTLHQWQQPAGNRTNTPGFQSCCFGCIVNVCYDLPQASHRHTAQKHTNRTTSNNQQHSSQQAFTPDTADSKQCHGGNSTTTNLAWCCWPLLLTALLALQRTQPNCFHVRAWISHQNHGRRQSRSCRSQAVPKVSIMSLMVQIKLHFLLYIYVLLGAINLPPPQTRQPANNHSS